MEIAVYAFIIISCGLGNAFAEANKYGAIFPSDIPLAIVAAFLLIFGLSKHKTVVKKTTFFACIFMFCQFVQGVVLGADLSFVLRDLKIWLYFFVPYWSVEYLLRNKPQARSRILLVFVVAIVMTLIQNWVFFLGSGLNGLVNSNLTRSFDYGMNFSIATVLAIGVMANKDWVQRRISIIGYYIVQAVCLISIVVSYTRSFWLIYGLVMIFYSLLLRVKDLEGGVKLPNILVGALIVITVMFGIQYAQKNYPEIYDVIGNRFSSIFVIDESGVNKDTLTGRFEYMQDTLVKFRSPHIIFGYGYGDLQKVNEKFLSFRSAESWNCENSVLYYFWKYGVIAASMLFFIVWSRISGLLKTRNKFQLALTAYICVWGCVGLMSGNFNSSFSCATFGLIFAFVQYGFDDVICEGEHRKK